MDFILVMTGSEHANLWWQVEPPDYEYEPADDLTPDSLEDRYDARIVRYTTNQLDSFDYLDGSGSHQLFDNVNISEVEGELSFSMPKRFVNSANLGKWALEVNGGRKWFKEHDDFGTIRFLANGTALWIPHLYPFEETDETGLPLILDRERCELTVSMTSMQIFEPDESPEVVITTPHATIGADDVINIEYTYGTDKNYYRQFMMQQKPLVSQLVSYDQRWRDLTAYLGDPTTPEKIEDYPKIMLGRVAMPEEYVRSKKPNDWTQRAISGHPGTAFGTAWVPVDELRRGIEADISFPNLSTSTDHA